MENKLSIEQLIKALRCCNDNGEYDSDCKNCPCKNDANLGCGRINEICADILEKCYKESKT